MVLPNPQVETVLSRIEPVPAQVELTPLFLSSGAKKRAKPVFDAR